MLAQYNTVAHHHNRLIVGLSLSDEQRAWLDRKAQYEERSLAWLVRRCIADCIEHEQGVDMIAPPMHSNGRQSGIGT